MEINIKYDESDEEYQAIPNDGMLYVVDTPIFKDALRVCIDGHIYGPNAYGQWGPFLSADHHSQQKIYTNIRKVKALDVVCERK